MLTYTAKFYTHSRLSNIVKRLSVRLIGKSAASDWTWVNGIWSSNPFGAQPGLITLMLKCEDLGDLIHIELQKHQLPLTFESEWYIYKVEVTSSNGHDFQFPIYHWVKKTKVYSFNEGKALRPFEEERPPCRIACSRLTEMGRRAHKYWWTKYEDGLPYRMIGEGYFDLPSELLFSGRKLTDFGFSAAPQQLKTPFYRFLERVDVFGWFTWKHPWKNFHDIKTALRSHIPLEEVCESGPKHVAQYIQEHWKDDDFFGYQCLNGVNPIKIRLCKSLPKDFRVTDDMVTLEDNKTLSGEIEGDKIFICDYETLEGLETGNIDGKMIEYLAAPFVLLHLTPDGELKPVAIQLERPECKDPELEETEPEEIPIFLPSDPDYEWLLAKIYVRGAEFSEHQLNTHLLRTHLLSEVFAVSLLRNTAKVHPLHKLLVPHTRYTLHINQLARTLLINKGGIFETFASTTSVGMTKCLQNSQSVLTYRSLCIHDDIEDRGMDSVRNYYYKDDGFKLWDIIEKFVKGVITFYYKTDDEIIRDTELQNYIKDIFEFGFLSNEESGIPQRFETVDELVKFATMVIFTASAQHAAVNNGQYGYGSWMLNTPTTLVQPPPKAKGEVTKETLLASLPEYKVAENAALVLKLLSTQSKDFRPLGDFPENQFTEEVPCQLIEEFQEELKEQDKKIKDRNDKLVKEGKLPYEFLMPKHMENSVAI